MSKKNRKHRKTTPRWLEYLFIGLVAALVIMLIVRAFLPAATTTADTSIVITEDGHVHTAAGEHIGTYEELFGTPWEGVTTTEGEETPADGETAPADGEAAPADGETAPADDAGAPADDAAPTEEPAA